MTDATLNVCEIDAQSNAEEPLTLADAAELMPGGAVHVETVRRWIRTGCVSSDRKRRAYLQARRVGGRLLVTRAAIAEFSEALSPRRAAVLELDATRPPRTRRMRMTRQERTMETLKAQGLI